MSADARVKPGDVLGGKYRVERVLGAGGMGMVVAATHVELGQRVALKLMLKAAMVDPLQAERFLREARAAVQLKSVHAARVLDVGKMPDGGPYIVMEYLEGNDLDDVVLRGGPLPSAVACGYILQAAEALAEAHGLGIVHRDLKPKNLFLTQSVHGKPLVKVLDFGVAKQVGIGGELALTSTSEVFGSPLYMSPEQMRSAKDVDARSDIWSLGVCLYELLTGHRPFESEAIAELCAMVLKDPAPPPSRYLPALAPELDAIVLRCLTKDPRARFQSVAELALALEPFAGEAGSSERIRQVSEATKQSLRKSEGRAGALPVELPLSAVSPATVSAWDTAASDPRVRRRSVWMFVLVPTVLAAIGISLIAVSLSSRSSTVSGGGDEGPSPVTDVSAADRAARSLGEVGAAASTPMPEEAPAPEKTRAEATTRPPTSASSLSPRAPASPRAAPKSPRPPKQAPYARPQTNDPGARM